MEKSFRDILSQFLEGNEAKSHSEPSAAPTSPENHSYVFEPLWQMENRPNPPREGVSRYKSQVRSPSQKSPQKPAPPPPPVAREILIPLEKLDSDSRVMVLILADLGAPELKSGVSLHRIKKAYRRLAKKYHPDRVSENSSPVEREAAKTAFFRLQKAYESLCESLAEDIAAAA